MNGRSGRHRGATRNRAYAQRECSSVAGLDDYVFDRHTKRICTDLRKYRGVALSLACRAGLDQNFAVGLHANSSTFERRQSGILDIACNAPPEIPPAFKSFLLPLKKVIAAALQHGIKAGVVVAAVIADG